MCTYIYMYIRIHKDRKTDLGLDIVRKMYGIYTENDMCTYIYMYIRIYMYVGVHTEYNVYVHINVNMYIFVRRT